MKMKIDDILAVLKGIIAILEFEKAAGNDEVDLSALLNLLPKKNA